MGIGSTGTGALPRGFARLEAGVGSPTFSPGQIVNGRVAQVGPKGVVVEVAGRLATMLSDLELAVGDAVHLAVKEATRDQILLQLVGREGWLLAGEIGGEPRRAGPAASYRPRGGRSQLGAVRKLLARGIPVTRENLERLVQEKHPGFSAGLDPESTEGVVLKLLQSYDLPTDEPHRFAARQLLARRLPITKENVEQLARTLPKLGGTSEADFQVATYLRSNELPLTEASLGVMRALLPPLSLGRQLHHLRWGLAHLSDLLKELTAEVERVGEEIPRLVDLAAMELSRRVVGASGSDRPELVESLRRVLGDQGVSVENRLARIVAGKASADLLEGDLRVLLGRLAEISGEVAVAPPSMQEGAVGPVAELRRALERLADSAPRLADALQAQQLRNAGRSADPVEQWAVFQVPIAGALEDAPGTVELRIDRRAGGRIDPDRVRLVVRLDLERLWTVEVRLEIAGRQIRCHLAGSDPAALPILREGFPELRAGLEGLGYSVAPAGFGLLAGEPDPTELAVEVPPRLVQVDLQV